VPPLPATVTLQDRRPVHVESPGPRGTVRAAAGPWRTAGEWWAETAWDREEWDVALADGAVCRLARDLTTGAWAIDGLYD
jgi:protein ImuB